MRARSGKTWPGWTRSCAVEVGSIATWIVRARSWAEMPGRDAFAGLDRDRERGAEGRLVLVRHLAQPELLAPLGREAEADQPAPVRRHEVDGLGRDELRRDREVALVLAVLVVDDDDEPSRADLLDRLLDGREDGAGCLGAHRLIVPSRAVRSYRRREARLEQALDVLREHVDLEVDALAGHEAAERRLGQRVRDQRHAERVVVQLGDRQRDALDGDRALLDAVAERVGGRLDDHAQPLALRRRPTAPCRRRRRGPGRCARPSRRRRGGPARG